jgi:hypothetical protein
VEGSASVGVEVDDGGDCMKGLLHDARNKEKINPTILTMSNVFPLNHLDSKRGPFLFMA